MIYRQTADVWYVNRMNTVIKLENLLKFTNLKFLDLQLNMIDRFF